LENMAGMSAVYSR